MTEHDDGACDDCVTDEFSIFLPLSVVEQVKSVLAYRSCNRRGPGGHYNSVRCFDQGTPGHISDEYENEPLAENKWCDGCLIFIAFKTAIEENTSTT